MLVFKGAGEPAHRPLLGPWDGGFQEGEVKLGLLPAPAAAFLLG